MGITNQNQHDNNQKFAKLYQNCNSFVEIFLVVFVKLFFYFCKSDVSAVQVEAVHWPCLHARQERWLLDIGHWTFAAERRT